MYNVVITHDIDSKGLELLSKQGNIKYTIVNKYHTDEYMDVLREADALLHRMSNTLTEDILAQLPRLKVLASHGVGYDMIEPKLATKYGIALTNTPGCNSRTVAEHVMAFIYSLSKDYLGYVSELKKGNYAYRYLCTARELEGSVALVAGFGRIGKITSDLLRANGLNVIVFDPFVSRDIVEKSGYKYEENLTEALAKADYVTLHVPLSKETEKLIGRAEFAAMKKSACLINCARGGVVDEKALYDALINREIAAAAVDVLCEEPMNPANPLFKLDNFIATPHSAGLTKEALSRISTMAAESIITILNGERWQNTVNPEVFDAPQFFNKQASHKDNSSGIGRAGIFSA